MNRTTLLILSVVLALVACQNPSSLSPSTTGTIHVSLQAPSRTIVADWTSLIASYTLTFRCTSETTADVTQTVSAAEAASAVSVVILGGTWNVSVSALSSAGIVVGAASQTGCVLASGGTLNLTLPVSASQTGTGSYSFTFDFPPTVADTVVAERYALTDLGTVLASQTPTITTVDSSTSRATVSETNIASGAYYLKLTFKLGAVTTITTAVHGESINVWDNVTSDQWLTSTGTVTSKRVFTASEFTSGAATVYTAPGIQTISITSACTVTVKVWGAGGGCGRDGYKGGGGGYSISQFAAAAGDSLYVVVGQGGGYGTSPTVNLAYGGTGNGAGSGGGGSVVALVSGGTSTLKACAGGGGGSSAGYNTGGGGGGLAGLTEGYGMGVGGTLGVGGVDTNGGGSGYDLGLTIIEGSGGGGASAQVAGGGGGGGGYGGGSAPAYSSLCYGGCGGGGYAIGPTWTTTTGSIEAPFIGGDSVYYPANTSDPNYVTGVGVGSSTTTINGGNGLIVVILQ